jgi:leucyl-tRNA synthetase
MGWGNDWAKEISTLHSQSYYKWTQWLFAQLYKDESGISGWSHRSGGANNAKQYYADEQDQFRWKVLEARQPATIRSLEKKEVKQWFFKVTDYADELLGSDRTAWTGPTSVKDRPEELDRSELKELIVTTK